MKTRTITFSDFRSEEKMISEVFIIEALTNDDVRAGCLDGYILFQQMKMMGGDPRYVRVASENDFKAAMVMFRESNYKFLHISCHGDQIRRKVRIGETWFGYGRIAIASRQMLKSRRVTFSACELGNTEFCKSLCEKSHWMHSFIAPTTEVDAKVSSAFWVSLYTLMLTNALPAGNDISVNTKELLSLSMRLGAIFKIPLFAAYPDTKVQLIKQFKLINGKQTSLTTIPFSSVKPERYRPRRQTP